MDQTAFFKLSYGLYIISTTSEGKDAGCVANTLHQVTSSPAQLAVTLNKDNYTEQLIEKSGRFSAVVLTQSWVWISSEISAFVPAGTMTNSSSVRIKEIHTVCLTPVSIWRHATVSRL